jgi:Transposase and inactivated derivatives
VLSDGEVIPNPRYLKQSACDAIVPKALWQRTHDCPHCGLKIDRDLNAAINILRRGLESAGIDQRTSAWMWLDALYRASSHTEAQRLAA